MLQPHAPTTFAGHNIEEEIKQERRLTGIEICNTRWVSQVRVETGKRKSFPLKCKNWRHPIHPTQVGCQACFEDRQKSIKERVAAALVYAKQAGTTLVVREVSPANERSLRNKLRRRGIDFLRLPTSSSTVYFHFAQANLSGELYTAVDFGDENWERLSFTPQRKRISGGLGRVESDADDADRVSVEVAAVILTDISSQIQDDDWEQALTQTSHLMPVSLDEAVSASNERIEVFATLLQNSVAAQEMTLTECSWLDAHARAAEQVRLVSKFQRVTLIAIDWESPTSNY